MGAFSDLVNAKGLKPEAIFWRSQSLEQAAEGDEGKLRARAKARGGAEKPKSYEVGKPNSGRGVSRKVIAAAMNGEAITRKSRSKLVKAINAELAKKKADPVTATQLFAGVPVRSGGKTKPKPPKKEG
jgi:hypothetical protein